jgi:hypothetical protein
MNLNKLDNYREVVDLDMLHALQKTLRQYQPWLEFQELNREGWFQAWQRAGIQQLILNTQPIRTANTGSIEVRVLTWRRDWLNTIWSLKSFYYYAQVDYPLFIHDGGLKPIQIEWLKNNFPDATILKKDETDAYVLTKLKQQKLDRCFAYRYRSPFGRRLIDFYLMSDAKAIITIDADVIFFNKPNELIVSSNEVGKNKYNKDMSYYYSMENHEIVSAFEIYPVSLINAGLSLVWRESVDFNKINEWLANPKLFDESWLTEQTIHALLSTIYGVELLPETYRLGTTPGLENNSISKHYPSRTALLYQEGMQHLIKTGFIDALSACTKR